MKRNGKLRGMFCMLAASALLLGGCAQGQGQLAYIGVDAAKKQILSELGLNESQVKIDSVDMATKNGMDYYHVEFSDDNGNTYRYDIDALTGKVIESAAAGDAADGTAAETAAAGTTAETTAAAADPGTEITVTAVRGTRAAANDPTQAANSTTRSAAADNPTQPAAAGSAKLTAEEAKAKALAHAGLSASQVTFTKEKLDWEDGKQVYDVEFYGKDMTEYDYEVDAATGAVLSVDKDRDAAQRPTQAAAATNPTQAAAGNAKLTADEAKAKALAHAGLSASQATFTKAEPDRDNGRETYDIEFYGNGGTEYEYEIDAYTGEVIQYSAEAPKTQGTGSQSAGGSGSGYTILAEESAKQLALAQVPGATFNDITEFETDRGDGRIAYEGTICHGGMEYEFEIDAYSGAFRKWECEPVESYHDGGHRDEHHDYDHDDDHDDDHDHDDYDDDDYDDD